MVAEATETCRWIITYDQTYFIDAHLLVRYVSRTNIYVCLHKEVSFARKWSCMLRHITRVNTRCVQKWILVLNIFCVQQKTRSNIFPVPRNTVRQKDRAFFSSRNYLREFCVVNNLLLSNHKHTIHVSDVITDKSTIVCTGIQWAKL